MESVTGLTSLGARNRVGGSILPITGEWVPDGAREKERQRRYVEQRAQRRREARARGEPVPYYRPTKEGRWHKPWQPWEVAYLRAHWGQGPDAAVARALGRSLRGVQTHAHRLHLLRRDAGVPRTTIARLFGCSVRDNGLVPRWIRMGLLVPIPTAGGRRRFAVRVSSDSLLAFIRHCGWAYDVNRMQAGHPLTRLARRVHEADPWLTVAQAAAVVYVCPTTLRRWLALGLASARRRPQLGTYAWVVQRSALEGLVERAEERAQANIVAARLAALARQREGQGQA